MLLGIGHQFLAGIEIPLTPRGDDRHIRFQRISTQFKPHLIITFTCSPMRNGIRASFIGNLNQAFGNQWPRDRRTQQVFTFVDGIGAKHGKNILTRKLLAQIFNINFLDPHRFSFGTRGFYFFSLTDISGEGHHFTTIGIL